MLRPTHRIVCLLLAASFGACSTRSESGRVRQVSGCHPRRQLTYCVTAWSRDPWNERSREAIGLAAQAWNRVGPYELREVYCNYPHDVPIFFDRGVHGDGHAPAAWGTELAHATYPGSPHQFIHVQNELEWWQAEDTLNRGYDLRSVILHEFGHNLGLAHDFNGDSIMTPYEERHTPRWGDIERVRANARRCGIEAPPPVEITAPAPGATWHHDSNHTIVWQAPTLEGHVNVDVFFQGQPWRRVWEGAPVSGEISVRVDDNWPLGCPYEIRVTHPTAGQISSSMILVAP